MLIVFFDSEGIVRSEFGPWGTIVNFEYYQGLLQSLRNDALDRLDKSPFVISVYRTTCCYEFASFWQKNVIVCPHSPYSADLASCDFGLFAKLKTRLKGNRFDTLRFERAAQGPSKRSLPEVLPIGISASRAMESTLM